MKSETCKSSYYKDIKYLKIAKIDFAQKIEVGLTNNIVNFNPFEYKEVV